MSEAKRVDSSLVTEIVRGYVANNTIAAGELPNLIATVHRSLAGLGAPAETPAPNPAVAINRSFGSDFVVCLECGWRGQMIRRHLTTAHNLSPREYRSKWGLKGTHPLVAPAYTKRRSALAKELGLGRSLRPAEVASQPPAPAPKRRGRTRRTAPVATTP
jgi:predicted transcriptional regulator